VASMCRTMANRDTIRKLSATAANVAADRIGAGIILGSYISAHVPDTVLWPVLATTLMVVSGRLVL
jgi:hypothetical protein